MMIIGRIILIVLKRQAFTGLISFCLKTIGKLLRVILLMEHRSTEHMEFLKFQIEIRLYQLFLEVVAIENLGMNINIEKKAKEEVRRPRENQHK